ncbi:MAG: hypothetical protein PHR51_02720 [Patescibacteria group bacterium]|nr:hypothetical protein [Patescibacteria group bacterium]
MGRINLVPPVTVAKQAEKGLELRRRFGRGGTAVGIARARDLKNRKTLTPETIMRMVSYFARHEIDKKGKDFYNKERPSNGYIAWLLWGGEPGKTWANKTKGLLK